MTLVCFLSEYIWKVTYYYKLYSKEKKNLTLYVKVNGLFRATGA